MSDLETVEILLIDDSDADAEMTVRALNQGDVADTVIRLEDGVEVPEFLERTGAYSNRGPGDPKLILLDIKTPRMDGIDVVSRLKSNKLTY